MRFFLLVVIILSLFTTKMEFNGKYFFLCAEKIMIFNREYCYEFRETGKKKACFCRAEKEGIPVEN